MTSMRKKRNVRVSKQNETFPVRAIVCASKQSTHVPIARVAFIGNDWIKFDHVDHHYIFHGTGTYIHVLQGDKSYCIKVDYATIFEYSNCAHGSIHIVKWKGMIMPILQINELWMPFICFAALAASNDFNFNIHPFNKSWFDCTRDNVIIEPALHQNAIRLNQQGKRKNTWQAHINDKSMYISTSTKLTLFNQWLVATQSIAANNEYLRFCNIMRSNELEIVEDASCTVQEIASDT